MKTLFTFILIVFLGVNSLFTQDAIFKSEQVLLETRTDGWDEIFILDDINEDKVMDYFGMEDNYFVSYISSDDSLIRDELDAWFLLQPMEVLDFDGDGIKDVMSEGKKYYKGLGNGSFDYVDIDEEFFGFNLVPMFGFMDIDNNGYIDLLSEYNSYTTSELIIYYQDETGFTKVVVNNDIPKYGYVEFKDLNGDEFMDIVMTTDEPPNDYYIVYFLNNGDRTFTKKIIDPYEFNKGNFINVDDLDNDGDLDLLFYKRFGGIYLIENDNGVYKREVQLNDFDVQVSKLSDINNDGYLDIVFVDVDDDKDETNVYYQLNNGSLKFATPKKLGTISKMNHFPSDDNYYKNIIQLVDVNFDNSPDIVVNAPKDKKIIWFENKTKFSTQIEILTQPKSKEVCIESSVQFKVEASGADIVFQWQKDGVDINGAINNIYTIDGVSKSDEGEYKCIISGSGNTLISNAATLTVYDKTSIIKQPISITKCEGESISISVSGIGKDINYQWQKDGVDLTGATSKDLVIDNASVGDEGDYTCIVTGQCGTLTSNIAKIVIKRKIQITTQPQSQDIGRGKETKFEVKADGTIDTYQWYKDDIVLNDGGKISGATTSQLIISDVASGEQGNYSVKISGDCGDVQSTNATLSVITSTDDFSYIDVSVLPNPTSKELNIVGLNKGEYYIEIIDLSGKKIYKSNTYISGKHSINNISKLQEGIYFLRIKNKDISITKKVVKVK